MDRHQSGQNGQTVGAYGGSAVDRKNYSKPNPCMSKKKRAQEGLIEKKKPPGEHRLPAETHSKRE